MSEKETNNGIGPATSAPETAPAEDIRSTEEVDWKAEAEKSRDMFLRTLADMENMKKRLERERTDLVKYANEDLIKKILPLLDNLERALAAAQGGTAGKDGLVEGVRLTYDGVMNVLVKAGVKQVVAVGEKFDPTVHEAVMQKDDPVVESNTVLEEIQKGYLLHERLIRPAMVVVSRRSVETTNNVD
ncbi:MAG: nucleotide exchange factor GrpE [Deltaproteobacteria bacterium]|nr:nucleotide exchange factor GrpE [Deltaproteobacteria bacterium]